MEVILEMKKLILPIIFLLLSNTVFAQNQDSQALNRQISMLYQQGKIDEAIPLAESVVEIEKKSSKESESYATALMTLAALHRERFRLLKKQREKALPEERRNYIAKINDEAGKAETLLRESLRIYSKSSNGKTPTAASAKIELAWLMENYLAPARTITEAKARINEAERLYNEALAAQEKLSGADADATLQAVLALGNFHTRRISFEKALPLYERYIAAVEKKRGRNDRALVAALRSVTEILTLTSRESEAAENLKRISSITGKPETPLSLNPNLLIRAESIEPVKSKRFFRARIGSPSNEYSYEIDIGSSHPTGTMEVRMVLVNVVVDENGNVVEAKTVGDIKEKQQIESAALKSKIRPFVYNGAARKMRGCITYAYREQ